jgi:hypothetical protein
MSHGHKWLEGLGLPPVHHNACGSLRRDGAL